MKTIKFFAIIFFDFIDIFFHQRRILKILKKNLTIKTFIDVGCHKGTYTDLIINNFIVTKALLFEPQTNIFKFLKKKYKKKKNIKIFNKAISENNKKKKIYINKHDLTSSLVRLNEKKLYLKLKAKLFSSKKEKFTLIKKVKEIKTIKLVGYLKKYNIKLLDLLKIDTEGHELEVLRGLSQDIKKVRYLLIEFHRDKIYFNYDPKKINKYLIKNGFVLKKRFLFPFTSWEDRLYKNNLI